MPRRPLHTHPRQDRRPGDGDRGRSMDFAISAIIGYIDFPSVVVLPDADGQVAGEFKSISFVFEQDHASLSCSIWQLNAQMCRRCCCSTISKAAGDTVALPVAHCFQHQAADLHLILHRCCCWSTISTPAPSPRQCMRACRRCPGPSPRPMLTSPTGTHH